MFQNQYQKINKNVASYWNRLLRLLSGIIGALLIALWAWQNTVPWQNTVLRNTDTMKRPVPTIFREKEYRIVASKYFGSNFKKNPMKCEGFTLYWDHDNSINNVDLIGYCLHSRDTKKNDLQGLDPHIPKIFYTLESPAHESSENEQWMSNFNIIVSYHRSRGENEFYYPYFVSKFNQTLTYKFQDKPYDIGYGHSNCWTQPRASLVRELMKHVKIDAYGACFNNMPRIERNSDQLYKYKVMFAIENSLCEDYITEKIINAFKYDAVPIVASWNGVPEYWFLPKDSYINVYDFKNMVALAEHLKKVISNETVWMSYMENRAKKMPDNYTRVYSHTWCNVTEYIRKKGKDIIKLKVSPFRGCESVK